MPFADCNGVQIYYEECGSGEAVIWCHEFGADYRTWEAQVRRFGRDYRCITYNARGFPPSAVPENGDAYDYTQQRDDIGRLMDALGIKKAHLVGLSMGAYAALQFALAYPERTLSVVFSSGGSGSMVNPDNSYRDEVYEGADRILKDGMEAGAHGLALGATRVQLQNKDPRGWEQWRGYLAEHSALGSSLALKNFQAVRPSLYGYKEALSKLDVPVLLLVGDEDDPVIEVNVFLKRVLKRAGLTMFARTGHAINLEEPDAYNAQIAAFFSAVERGTWGERDPRASPAQSVFMGDKAEEA